MEIGGSLDRGTLLADGHVAGDRSVLVPEAVGAVRAELQLLVERRLHVLSVVV